MLSRLSLFSHFSRHSHQHPRSNNPYHLCFDSPHLSPAIKTPVISTLLPITHCPVYRSHASDIPVSPPLLFSSAPTVQQRNSHCKSHSINTLVLQLTSVSPSLCSDRRSDPTKMEVTTVRSSPSPAFAGNLPPFTEERHRRPQLIPVCSLEGTPRPARGDGGM